MRQTTECAASPQLDVDAPAQSEVSGEPAPPPPPPGCRLMGRLSRLVCQRLAPTHCHSGTAAPIVRARLLQVPGAPVHAASEVATP